MSSCLLAVLTTLCALSAVAAYYFSLLDSSVYEMQFEQSMVAGKHTQAQRRFATSAAYFRQAIDAARHAHNVHEFEIGHKALAQCLAAQSARSSEKQMVAPAQAAHRELRLEEAKEQYKQILRNQVGSGDQKSAAATLVKLADVYMLGSDMRNAKVALNKATDMFEANHDWKHADECLTTLSGITYDEKLIPETEDALKRRLELRKKLYREPSYEVASGLADIGALYSHNMPKRRNATPWLEQARAMFEKCNCRTEEYDVCLQELTVAYRLEGRFDKALETARFRVNQDERIFGVTNSNTAAALIDLATLVPRRERASLLEDALKILRPRQSALYLKACREYARLCLKEERLEEAEKILAESIPLGERMTVKMAEQYLLMARVKERLGKYKEGAAYAEKASNQNISISDHERAANLIRECEAGANDKE